MQVRGKFESKSSSLIEKNKSNIRGSTVIIPDLENSDAKKINRLQTSLHDNRKGYNVI